MARNFVWAQAALALGISIGAGQVVAQDNQTSEAGVTAGADAQATAETEAAPKSRSRRRTLDEVIVTAQKRAQNLQEVPMSVTAIGGLQIEESNMEDLNDLSRYTPNLKVQAGGVANFIYIRGLGSGFNEGFDQSVGIFIDDIYYSRVHYLVAALLDIDRVEILRGPQGTLFGKNTVAGALSLHSAEPDNEFGVSADLNWGEHNLQTYSGSVNVPIIEDKVYARVAAYYSDRDGFMHNTTVDKNDGAYRIQAMRAKLKWDITDDWSVMGTYLHNRGEILSGMRTQLSAAPDHWLTLFRAFDAETETDIENFNTAIDVPAFGVQESVDYILKSELEALNHDFTLILGTSTYNRDGGTDLDATPIPVFAGYLNQDYEQYSAELRIASPPGVFEYVAGAFYHKNSIRDFTHVDVAYTDNRAGFALDLDLVNSITGGLQGPIVDILAGLPFNSGQTEQRDALFLQDAESGSVFGQATWNIIPELSLIVGARYGFDSKKVDYDHKIGTPFLTPGPTVILQPLLRLESFETKVKRRENDFAPKVSGLWRMTDWANYYLTYAEGGKSGGFNALALRPDETAFEPEKAITYETGVKLELLDNSMRLNIGLFRTEFDNLQTSIFDGIDIIVINAPEAVSQGVEIDMNAIFGFGLSAVGSFAYLDAYYKDFKEGPCIAQSVLADPISQERPECDLSGKPLANAPEIQASLALNQVFALGQWPIDLALGTDILYHGNMHLQSDLDPLDDQDAYWMFNLRAGLQAQDHSWSLTFFVRNVTDEIVALAGGDTPLFDGGHFKVIDQPRVFSLHLNMAF
ncbi:MAG: TonB-dependent receptor [Alphaproteobacteria bacterium]